jgi:hypothetical protein
MPYRYGFITRTAMPGAAMPLASAPIGCVQKIIRMIAIFGFVHQRYRNSRNKEWRMA